MGVLIYLPFKTSASADQVLCFLLEPSETTYCLLSFLVNLNSSLRVVNYSVNLYFILKEINYMKCCLLDGFNGYWLMAVLNCLTKPSIVQCAKYLRAYFERSQLLLIGTSYQVIGVNFKHLKNRSRYPLLESRVDWATSPWVTQVLVTRPR